MEKSDSMLHFKYVLEFKVVYVFKKLDIKSKLWYLKAKIG